MPGLFGSVCLPSQRDRNNLSLSMAWRGFDQRHVFNLALADFDALVFQAAA